jgi:hypothetical protein
MSLASGTADSGYAASLSICTVRSRVAASGLARSVTALSNVTWADAGAGGAEKQNRPARTSVKAVFFFVTKPANFLSLALGPHPSANFADASPRLAWPRLGMAAGASYLPFLPYLSYLPEA